MYRDNNESHSSKKPADATTGLLPSAMRESQPLVVPPRSLFTAPIQVAEAGTSGPNAANWAKSGFSDLKDFIDDAREGKDDDADDVNVILNYREDDEYDSQEERETDKKSTGPVDVVAVEREKRVSMHP